MILRANAWVRKARSARASRSRPSADRANLQERTAFFSCATRNLWGSRMARSERSNGQAPSGRRFGSTDRKSGGYGKRESGSGGLGGRLNIKKKNSKRLQKKETKNN